MNNILYLSKTYRSSKRTVTFYRIHFSLFFTDFLMIHKSKIPQNYRKKETTKILFLSNITKF